MKKYSPEEKFLGAIFGRSPEMEAAISAEKAAALAEQCAFARAAAAAAAEKSDGWRPVLDHLEGAVVMFKDGVWWCQSVWTGRIEGYATSIQERDVNRLTFLD